MTYAIAGLTFSIVSFICGYYVAHRGLKGVQNDLTDVKTDVENLKKATSNAPAPVAL